MPLLFIDALLLHIHLHHKVGCVCMRVGELHVLMCIKCRLLCSHLMSAFHNEIAIVNNAKIQINYRHFQGHFTSSHCVFSLIMSQVLKRAFTFVFVLTWMVMVILENVSSYCVTSSQQ